MVHKANKVNKGQQSKYFHSTLVQKYDNSSIYLFIYQQLFVVCLFVAKRSLGQLNVLHLSVILFTGGCLPHCMLGTPLDRHPLGRHPSGQTHSPGRHPLPLDTTGCGQQAGGTYSTGIHSCLFVY